MATRAAAGEAPALSAASAPYTRRGVSEDPGAGAEGGLSRGLGCRYPIPPSAGGGPIDW